MCAVIKGASAFELVTATCNFKYRTTETGNLRVHKFILTILYKKQWK